MDNEVGRFLTGFFLTTSGGVALMEESIFAGIVFCLMALKIFFYVYNDIKHEKRDTKTEDPKEKTVYKENVMFKCKESQGSYIDLDQSQWKRM